MKIVNITGTLANPADSSIIITVSGPDHHAMTYTFYSDFNLPLPVIPGDYYISISAFTAGTFTIDITGDCQNMMPQVPFVFKATRQTFYLNVAA